MPDVSLRLTVNGTPRTFNGDSEMPLLWHLREELGLVGAKFGCGLPTCGACKVHVNGELVPSCAVQMGSLDGATVRTVEGLADGDTLHPVQQAWIDEDVSQCGYCQAGQIMAAVKLLELHPRPTDEDIAAVMTNLCRCGSYARIRKAVHRAAAVMDRGS